MADGKTDGAADRCRGVAEVRGSSPRMTHRAADHRSRARCWHDAVGELMSLQTQYAAWLEALPTNLQDSSLAEIQAIDPPCGFGRDR
jgi:hypothetical protein